MRTPSIQSLVALLLVVVLSGALVGWVLLQDDDVLKETAQVGSEGIQKAEEVRRLLEESAPVQP